MRKENFDAKEINLITHLFTSENESRILDSKFMYIDMLYTLKYSSMRTSKGKRYMIAIHKGGLDSFPL